MSGILRIFNTNRLLRKFFVNLLIQHSLNFSKKKITKTKIDTTCTGVLKTRKSRKQGNEKVRLYMMDNMAYKRKRIKRQITTI